METTSKVNQLEATIDVKSLTLADWSALGEALGNQQKWAFWQWQEHSEIDFGQLSLDDWEAIAAATGYSDKWAYYRFKELAS